MKIDWYFDLISPFAYLQLPAMKRIAMTHEVTPRPILLGAVLKHWGQIGPAEIEPKRLMTYRLCQFTADRRGIPFRFPDRHPFNPLKALRLLSAVEADLDMVASAFGFVFAEGRTPDDEPGLEALSSVLGLAADLAGSEEAKARLRQTTDAAIARGVFGVPTIAIGDELFWGEDATGLAEAFIADPAILRRGEMARLSTLEIGARRNPGR